MQTQPKVSVIIPVYKAEKYLEDCLDSVINQSLKDIEIICVDDGSPDASLDILARYAARDNRLRLICQGNAGVSAARNAGFKHAKGSYVLFLDSDDMLNPDALEQLADTADKKQTDILYFDAAPFFENEALAERFRAWSDRGLRSQEYAGVVTGAQLFARMSKNEDYRANATWALYRREFLLEKQLRFYEGIVHEDELFTQVAMLEAESASHLQQPFYRRRFREESIMTSEKSYSNFRGYFTVYSELMRYVITRQLDAQTRKWLFKRIVQIRKSAINVYVQLPGSQRKGVTWTDDPYVCALFEMSRREIQAHGKKGSAAAEKELRSLKRDPVVRVWLKIRGGARCLREHGAVYTLRRVGSKLRALLKRHAAKKEE